MKNTMRYLSQIVRLILSIALSCIFLTSWVAQAKSPLDVKAIKLPDGFHIEVYTDSVPNARSMALGSEGTLYVGTHTEGKVYALPDRNGDHKPDQVLTLASGLKMPNGVAIVDDALYIAEVHQITRLKNISSQLEKPPERETIYNLFPSKIHHGWKYLRLGPDGKLYTAVGAPCNICEPDPDKFAIMVRLNPDGSDYQVFARGIRNTVGFDWHPKTQTLWFTDNGRDHLGDDVPPDELNQASKQGQHFGYPYCHAGNISDPKLGNKPCQSFSPPAWRFPAHVAPLGIRFYTGKQFPESYQNQLFVAQHGSWNRSQAQGYRVVLLRFKNGIPVEEQVFAEGWLKADGTAWGRPVDIIQLADGSLLISDDQNGAIYRIFYQKV